MKNIILISLILIVIFLFSGCVKVPDSEYNDDLNKEEIKSEGIGMANPSSIYCHKLGYKTEGGFCIFPDNTKCDSWKFYRGKCGTKWSYCAKNSYDMKNLTKYEGWGKGAICTSNKENKGQSNIAGIEITEIGNVHDLMNINTIR